MVTVSGAKIEETPIIIPAVVQKTIKSIKEVVGNRYADVDVYATLKESSMDPNESVQKLLHQDTFHEVKRRRNKKKESTMKVEPVQPVRVQPQRKMDNTDERTKPRTYPSRTRQRAPYPQNLVDGRSKVLPTAGRSKVLPAAGRSKEFRVVRDNRVNHNINKEIKPALQQGSTPVSEPITSKQSEMSSTGTSNSQKSLGGETVSQALNGPTNSNVRPASDTNLSGNILKELSEGQTIVSNTAVRGITTKPIASQSHPTRPSSGNSVVGVYSSSLDPVHVPSPGSRSSTAVGAIRREVGVVGVRKQPSQSVKHPSTTVSSLTNPILEKHKSSSTEAPQLFSTSSKSNQLNQSASHESSIQNMPSSRPLLTNHYGSRSSHQATGHKKAFKPNKEWKPKSNKKTDDIAPGRIGLPAKSVIRSADIPVDYSTESKTEAVKMQDNLSRLNIFDSQNVVIADHLRVAETDRCQLTFGSIVPGFEPVGSAEASTRESSPSMSPPAQKSSHSDIPASGEVDKQEDAVTNSHSHPPASAAAAEHHVQSSSPHNLESYADIGIVHENKQFYASLEPQHIQEAAELPSFTAYDPPTGYDMPYYRPTMDVSSRGHGLPSPQEDLNSYMANNIPSSTISMMPQQQQQPLGQMYPQVHLSQFSNMPYRQFISPVYVPQMAMPGYSSPAYPHQSNGGNYMVMPGGNSHPNMSSLKYGIQQFKPLPNPAPTGFGNYTSPSGYAMNAPGVVGGAIGLEDSSRLKYKDGNLYVPNPQAETSEMWIQNQRDLQGMQSAQYYNMTGQQTPHGAYLPSHNGHTQFSPPGMYHPQQQPGLASPHHLAPGMGSNLAGMGIPAAVPRAQVGPYQQQPQLNHLNWIPNL